jgi:hypothetical protein
MTRREYFVTYVLVVLICTLLLLLVKNWPQVLP